MLTLRRFQIPRLPIRRSRWTRGQTLPVLAMMMTTLLGMTALAVDAGFAYAATRQQQTVADAAALAAAYQLQYSSGDCSDTVTTQPAVVAVAQKYIKNNGYDYSTDSTIAVQVNCPYNGSNTTVRVYLSKPVGPFFSAQVFGASLAPKVSGVGSVIKTIPQSPLMALGTGCKTDGSGNPIPGIKSSGSGTISVTGGGIHSNSSCTSVAVLTSGSGDVISADAVTAVGGCTASNSGPIVPPCTTGVPVQSDPISSSLVTLPCVTGSAGSYSLSTSVCNDYTGTGSPFSGTSLYTWSGSATRVIGPGVYYGISPGNGALYLRPGIYVMKGGGMQWNGNGDVKTCRGAAGEPTSGDGSRGASSGCSGVTASTGGVMIFNTSYGYPTGYPACPTTSPANTFTQIDLGGNGSLDLAPLASGAYQGVMLWQDKCLNASIKLGGTGSTLSIAGTVYAPNNRINFGGNGGLTSTGSFYADGFDVSGSGTISINYNSTTSYQPPSAVLTQ